MSSSLVTNLLSVASLAVGLSNRNRLSEVDEILNYRINKAVSDLNIDFSQYADAFKDASNNKDVLSKIAGLSASLTLIENELYSLTSLSELPNKLNLLLSPEIVSILSKLIIQGYEVKELLLMEAEAINTLAKLNAEQSLRWNKFAHDVQEVLVNYKIDIEVLSSQVKMNTDMIFALSWEVVALKEELRLKIASVTTLIDDSVKSINTSMGDLNLAANNSTGIITSAGKLVLNDRAVVVSSAIAKGNTSKASVAETSGVTLTSCSFSTTGTCPDAGLTSALSAVVLDKITSFHIPNVNLNEPLFLLFRTSAEGILKAATIDAEVHVKNIAQSYTSYTAKYNSNGDSDGWTPKVTPTNIAVNIGSSRGFVFPSVQTGVLKTLKESGFTSTTFKVSSLCKGETPLSGYTLPALVNTSFVAASPGLAVLRISKRSDIESVFADSSNLNKRQVPWAANTVRGDMGQSWYKWSLKSLAESVTNCDLVITVPALQITVAGVTAIKIV